jgi:hypothetical protein
VNLDPLQGNPLTLVGTAQVSQPLNLDQSGGHDSGALGLAYNSERASNQPIITATLQTANNVALATVISAQLTWNGGTPQTSQTYLTTGLSAGQQFTLAQQVNKAMTTAGRYTYSM